MSIFVLTIYKFYSVLIVSSFSLYIYDSKCFVIESHCVVNEMTLDSKIL